MVQSGNNDHIMWQGTPVNHTAQNQPTRVTPVLSSEEDVVADLDEPPDLERTPRPSLLKLHDSFRASFSKRAPPPFDRKQSLLTNALHSNEHSPVEETTESDALRRGLSSASFWSSNSASTAELTSDDGVTSPNARSRTPSPPLPATTLHTMVPILNKDVFRQDVSIVQHDEDHIDPLQKASKSVAKEDHVEMTLGRKRCIKFACGDRKEQPKPVEAKKPEPEAEVKQTAEPAKRVCTIKFACPSKISTDGPSMGNKSRVGRNKSPAPRPHKPLESHKPSQQNSVTSHRSKSPVDTKLQASVKDRSRRLSLNPELGKTEAYRFHEFASSDEEVDEWVQESTCHRSRLTITDTLKIENGLRRLGEEAEEEALDDEDNEDQDDEIVDADLDDDDDDHDEDADEEDYVSDEGFQTDDEEGFAGSDDDSDGGSDFRWWAPGAESTAATSVEYLDHIRPNNYRTGSVSSIESTESQSETKRPRRPAKTRKSRPVNIRVPSPELPDSTDFVCGTLDEDRPLEQAYLSCLEQRRAAKRKLTPQDIDPTFPTSDPEMDEEDEDDEEELAIKKSVRAIHAFHEGEHHPMMVGPMDQLDQESRGRSKAQGKRSPGLSPKRMRSPPPSKRVVHRSPPPRKLFGQSPKRLRSPAPVARLRSPPPTRRGSANVVPTRRTLPTVRFGGLAERPALTTSSSLPRTPVTAHDAEDSYDDDDTCCELPVRRAIDIKVGLEKKRQRRKEQQYRKLQRKNNKDKRPAPGKGAERMREMGLGLAAHRSKNLGFAFGIPPTPDQKDIHVLSV